MNSLQRAIEIARDKHDGQTDKIGKPYISHPIRVMKSLTNKKDKIVAVLHDVIEDSDTTLDDLLPYFDDDVIDALDSITRREDEDYKAYIKRVKDNPIAKRVKLQDIKDNLDPKRFLSIQSEKDKIRLDKKYRWALAELISNHSLVTITNSSTITSNSKNFYNFRSV